VELIETHPISKLTNTYNVRLLNKIKESFSEAEQQLFISSFYCYLNYDTKKEFVVDLDDVWKWMGFSKKYHANTVLTKHFIEKTDYINLAPSVAAARLDNEKWGGQNIKKIMMTIKCFKSLCLKAQTKKASEIHEYYLKMEEILHEVIEEEAIELKQKMEEQKYLLDQKTEELKHTPELERHKLLLRKYGVINGSLVYIVKIKQYENGSYIIKIGQSQKGIKNRMNEFKPKYGPHVFIMDCFIVQNSMGFEKYLHQHPEIHPHKVTTLEGHEKENELFMIGGNLTYQRLLEIIESNQPQYDFTIADYERLKLENEQLRAQPHTAPSQDMNPVLQDLLRTNQLLLQKVQILESTNKDILSRINALQTRTSMPTCSLPDPHLGPRLQKIHPETLQLIHVYESVTECIKEDYTLKRPSINKAVRENTIYHGYRWQFVDRELDPNTIHALQTTKETKIQKNGYIVKLNKEKTEILHVYLDRKTASQKNNYSSIASLDVHVKHKSLKDGYYYLLYDEVDESLRRAFTEKHGEIVLYHDGIGCFDTNNRLVKEYRSRYDCTIQTGMSQKSLAKVLNQSVLYKDHFYKSLGEKQII
jgi:hypothetical protein